MYIGIGIDITTYNVHVYTHVHVIDILKYTHRHTYTHTYIQTCYILLCLSIDYLGSRLVYHVKQTDLTYQVYILIYTCTCMSILKHEIKVTTINYLHHIYFHSRQSFHKQNTSSVMFTNLQSDHWIISIHSNL